MWDKIHIFYLPVAIQDIQISPSLSSKSQHVALSKSKTAKPSKVKEEKLSKEKAPEKKQSVAPPFQNQQFDATKPHWMMRIVVDAISAVS